MTVQPPSSIALKEIRDKYDAICEKRDTLGINSLTQKEKERYQFCLGKETLTVREKDHIRFYERRKRGYEYAPTKEKWEGSYRPNEEKRRFIWTTESKYRATYVEMIRSYDHQKGKMIIPYLTRKYEKYIERGMEASKSLEKILNIFNTIFPDKLQDSIAFRINGVNWGYGTVAVLRGKPKEVVGWLPSSGDNEARSFSPFQFKGEFFRLPLNGEHTLIIGDEKELAPHLLRLTQLKCRVVFTNTFTEQERVFFNLP